MGRKSGTAASQNEVLWTQHKGSSVAQVEGSAKFGGVGNGFGS